MTHVQAPVADRSTRRRQALTNLLRAWSIRPGDAHAKLTDSNGRLLTYPTNPETKAGELLHKRPSFQVRLNAKRALITPNVCLALPLSGGLLVPTKVQRY